MANASNQNAESNMVSGDIPPDTITQAKEDAPVFLKGEFGITDDNDNYSLLVRYYTCHLLYMWGFALTKISGSVDDISVSTVAIEFGDKEGMSPYLFELKKLVDEGDIFFSV